VKQNWVDLKSHIDWAKKAADTRISIVSKGGVDALNEDSKLSHLKGVLGEKVYAILNNYSVRVSDTADGGDDFPDGVNVKSAPIHDKYPTRWCVNKAAKKRPSKRYCFVELDIDTCGGVRGRSVGFLTHDQVKTCEVGDPGNRGIPCYMVREKDIKTYHFLNLQTP